MEKSKAFIVSVEILSKSFRYYIILENPLDDHVQ